MAAGGEAHDADLSGVDGPVGSVVTGEAQSALGIEKGGEVRDLVTGVFRQAVFQHDGSDAAGVEPVGDILAFPIVGENAVATAGTNDDGLAGGVTAGGETHLDGGLLNFRYSNDTFPRGHDLNEVRGLVIGGSARPQRDDSRAEGVGEKGQRGEQEQNETHWMYPS